MNKDAVVAHVIECVQICLQYMIRDEINGSIWYIIHAGIFQTCAAVRPVLGLQQSV